MENYKVNRTGQRIIVLKASSQAGRVKVIIPYRMKEEREAFKQLNGTYYHPEQKLWSIVNTKQHLGELKDLFASKLDFVDTEPTRRMPEITLSHEGETELMRCFQIIVIKGFSESTAKNYISSLRSFFKYFEKENLKEISKEQIEGYVFELIGKYRISESTQNGIINAIKCYYEYVLDRPREY